MKKTKSGSNAGYWIMAVFGLFFFLPGLFMAGTQVSMISKSMRAQSWVNVPAVVQEAELKYSYGSEGGTTYRATGMFEYEWQGQTYSSDRLFYGTGYDSDRSYHRGIMRKFSKGKRIEVKINPKRPDQAVAFPAIRWKLLGFMSVFSVIFGGVGAGIIAMTWRAKKSDTRESKRALQYPNEPWRWRDIWQTRKVKNSSKLIFYGVLALTVVWNLISWPIAFPLLEEVKKGEYWLVVFLSFPLIGLFAIFKTWQYYQSWKRFGRAYLELETYPAAPGHSFLGVLHVPGQPPADLSFHVKISCIREEERGSGDDRETVENVLWQDEQTIPVGAGRFGTDFELPVGFAIPADARTTSIEHTKDRAILWRISAEAESGNVKFDQDFEVPVFDVSEYRFHIPAEARQTVNTAKSGFQDKGNWQRTGVIHTDNPDGGYYYFPAAQHKGTAVMLSFMTVIFGGVAIAPFFTAMPLIFAFGFGLATLLVGFFALYMWLHKTAVDVRPGEMTVRHGLWNGKIEQVTADNIKSFELNSSMSSGDVKYYDIVAVLKSGKKLKLANHLLGKRDVQALMARIKGEMGLSS